MQNHYFYVDKGNCAELKNSPDPPPTIQFFVKLQNVRQTITTVEIRINQWVKIDTSSDIC